MILLDFETRSRVDLRVAGLHRYARDPSTEVLCAAFKFDGETKVYLQSDDHALAEFFNRVKAGEPIHAHNADFEWQLLRQKFAPHLEIPHTQMRCSMARAMVCGLPASLGELAKVLGVEAQKDAEGTRVMRIMCKPDKAGEWVWSPELQHKLEQYCIKDVQAEYACEQFIPQLPEKELALFHLTMLMNDNGILVDREACEAALELLDRHNDHINAQIFKVTSNNVQTGKQVQAMLKQFETWGLTLEDLSAGTIANALKTVVSPEVRYLLELRAEGAKASVAKYKKILETVCEDNRVRGTLKYYGASTGRFAGAGIQPQNFPRPKIKSTDQIADVMRLRDYDFFSNMYPSVNTAASAALRGMLIAEHEFFDADYSSIEARVLAWLANDGAELSAYHNGLDNYVAMASKIYHTPVDKVTDGQRQLGKQAVLGCGYGMGAPKFMQTCQGYGMDVDEKLAKLAVDMYRESHPQVTQFWRDCEMAAKKAIRNTGMLFRLNKLNFVCDGTWLKIGLPSSRFLWYYQPKIESKETQYGLREEIRFKGVYQGKLVPESTYGGKLVENITQAVARDVMAEAMLNLEKVGLVPTLSVHDEIIVDCPDSARYSEFQRVMETAPAWGLDIPLKVGAWRGQRFRK